MVKTLFVLNSVNEGAKNEFFDKHFLMVKSTPFPNFLLKKENKTVSGSLLIFFSVKALSKSCGAGIRSARARTDGKSLGSAPCGPQRSFISFAFSR